MIYVMLLLAVSLASCTGADTVYSSFVDIPSPGWRADEYCGFATVDFDSALFRSKAARYDVILAIRHTDDYPYSDIWILTDQEDAALRPLPDTLHLALSGRDGLWRGKMGKGICLFTDTIAKSVEIPEYYSLRLRHAMPVPVLNGMIGVGVIINKSEN